MKDFKLTIVGLDQLTVKAYDLQEAKLEARLLTIDGWLVNSITTPHGRVVQL